MDTQGCHWVTDVSIRKTKRGKIVKEVRLHVRAGLIIPQFIRVCIILSNHAFVHFVQARDRCLRDDISCKSPLCSNSRCQGTGRGGVNVGVKGNHTSCPWRPCSAAGGHSIKTTEPVFQGLIGDSSFYLIPDVDTISRFMEVGRSFLRVPAPASRNHTRKVSTQCPGGGRYSCFCWC